METVELVPKNSEISVEVSFGELSKLIGEQLVVDGPKEDRDFFYLCGIAIDGQQSDHSVEDILMEYIRNCKSFQDLSREECDQIEEIIR